MMSPNSSLIFLLLPLLASSQMFELPLKRWGTKATGHLDDLKVKYLAPMNIGTPPQKVEVAFHTGTVTSWVPLKGCKTSGSTTGLCKNNKNVFDLKKSSSFKNTTIFFRTVYEGAWASGHMFEDTVSFSSGANALTYNNKVSIGGAGEFQNGEHAVLGLPSFKYTLQDQGYEAKYKNIPVNTAVFTMYTVGCTAKGCGNRGQITFGGLDTKNCQFKSTYVKLIENNLYWDFRINGIYAAGARYVKSYTAVLDSGSAYITLPEDIFKNYMKKWGAKALEDQDTYAVPCTSNLDFSIKVGQDILDIPSANLLMPLSPEAQKKFGNNMCQLALKVTKDGSEVHLGEPLYRSYCITHNMVQTEIGFSKKSKPDVIDDNNNEEDKEKDDGKKEEEDCDEEEKKKEETKPEEDCDEEEKKKEETKPEEDCDEEEKKNEPKKKDPKKKDQKKNDQKKNDQKKNDQKKNNPKKKDNKKNDQKKKDQKADAGAPRGIEDQHIGASRGRRSVFK